MKTAPIVIMIVIVLVCCFESAFGQIAPLKGASAIELNMGLWGEGNAGQELTLSGVRMSAKSSGFAGSLAYCYWMREHVAVTVTAAFVSGEATSNAVLSSAFLQRGSSVVSFLIGARYYIPRPEPDDDVRAYLAAGLGSFVGFESSSSILAQSAHTESTFGGRLGAGLDVFLGSTVKLGAAVGFNAMKDFKTSVGARSNYDGFDASLGIGFAFGR